MRFKNIKIKNYRNIKDLDCSFDGSSVIGFIGNNGSGKSNVLENIVQTFSVARDYRSDRHLNYQFDYTYQIDSNIHRMEDNGLNFFYYKNNIKDIKYLKNGLPKVIFTYYAGETERLNSFSRYFNAEYNNYLKNSTSDNIEMKFITGISLKDFPLALFANYVFDTSIFSKIKELLHFDSIEESRIILHFKKPSWASVNESVETLWGARGFNKIFFDKLIQEDEDYGRAPFIVHDAGSDYITLAADHPDLFRALAKTPLELYTKLKAMSDSDFLQDFVLYVRTKDSMFHIGLFSEGEKQLACLLMLLDLSKEFKALFLLDEFDAYLHPNWQREFVKLISDIGIRGQVFFTTHSPATVSGLRRENVFIMKNGQVFVPNSETYNRALDEIMEEQMGISMRSLEFQDLEKQFRNLVVHGQKEQAYTVLNKIREIVGEEDPFFITANMALSRMN